MKEFKVNKSIEKRPVIFGLQLEAFRIFGTVTGIVILIGMFAFSLIILFVGLFVISAAYVLSSWLIDKKFIKTFSDDQLPDQVKNNL